MNFKFTLLVIILGFCSCGNKKTEPAKIDFPKSDTLVSAAEAKKVETETVQILKFDFPQILISKIDDKMDLGRMDAWKNIAGPGEIPSYFSTIEYSIGNSHSSSNIDDNVIELSIGSDGHGGTNVDYILIDVGFMSPQYKSIAKALFVQKVKLLSKLLDIEIPAKISEAIRTEKDLNLSLNNYSYEVEYFGEGSKWISLKMH